jgi:galactokinase
VTLTAQAREARAALESAFGPSPAAAVTGTAPGRCTLAGEHVDYADGLVLGCAIDLTVTVALRASADRRWRAVSAGRRVERVDPAAAGDIGDRLFAAALALGERIDATVPPLELAVVASVPEAAGLSSSAAAIVAAMVAGLRREGRVLTAADLAAAALHAERDLVGVPCGPLDHRAVVSSPERGALLLDCRDGSLEWVEWALGGVVLVACDTGEAHDVGGGGYAERRQQAEAALRLLSAASYREVDAEWVEAALDGVLQRRARHIVTETERAAQAAAALGAGDAARLGGLMTASGRSLRDDYEVSTPALDAVVAAALAHPGCQGARLVGAGFGGSAVALVAEEEAGGCRRAMETAASRVGEGRPRSWVLRPAPGVAITAADVVR